MSENVNNSITSLNNSLELSFNASNHSELNKVKHVFVGIHALPIRLFGVITNLINIIIFSDKKFKNKTFVYLFYHSISEFVYLSLACLTSIPYCGTYCADSFKYSIISELIVLYIDYYFTSSLAIFALLVEITLSFERYLVVSNSPYCGIIKNGSPHLISSVLFLISLFYYSPVVIFYRVEQSIVLANIYKLVKISEIYSYFSYLALFIRGPVFTIILTVINYKTLVKFKEQMSRKKMIKLEKSNKNESKFSIHFIY
jgi:hypothetical protein